MAIKAELNEDGTYTVWHDGKTYIVESGDLIRTINELEANNDKQR